MKTTRSGERTRLLVLMAYDHALVIIIEGRDREQLCYLEQSQSCADQIEHHRCQPEAHNDML